MVSNIETIVEKIKVTFLNHPFDRAMDNNYIHSHVGGGHDLLGAWKATAVVIATLSVGEVKEKAKALCPKINLQTKWIKFNTKASIILKYFTSKRFLQVIRSY